MRSIALVLMFAVFFLAWTSVPVYAQDEFDDLLDLPELEDMDEFAADDDLPLYGEEEELEPMDTGLAAILGEEPEEDLVPPIPGEDEAPPLEDFTVGTDDPLEDLGEGSGEMSGLDDLGDLTFDMPLLDDSEEEASEGLTDVASDGDFIMEMGLETPQAGVAALEEEKSVAVSGVMVSDGYWTPEHGKYVIKDDFYVAKGVTLYIYPGCHICVERGGGGQTDLYTTPQTDIVIAGCIKAVGNASQPVVFYGANGAAWGKLTVAGGSKDSVLKYVRLKGGVLNFVNSSPLVIGCDIIGGGVNIGKLAHAKLMHNRIHGCQDGVSLEDKSSRLEMVANEIYDNNYGLVLKEAGHVVSRGNRYRDNSSGDLNDYSDRETRAE